jgi:hypothetical protein
MNIDVYEEIKKCRESIDASAAGGDWHMVKAWEERLEFWVNQLFELDQ